MDGKSCTVKELLIELYEKVRRACFGEKGQTTLQAKNYQGLTIHYLDVHDQLKVRLCKLKLFPLLSDFAEYIEKFII